VCVCVCVCMCLCVCVCVYVCGGELSGNGGGGGCSTTDHVVLDALDAVLYSVRIVRSRVYDKRGVELFLTYCSSSSIVYSTVDSPFPVYLHD
jgi:hypothetical protein